VQSYLQVEKLLRGCRRDNEATTFATILSFPVEEVLPELVRLLVLSEGYLAELPARLLSRLGPRAAPAIPALVYLLKRRREPDFGTLWGWDTGDALDALVAIGAESVPALGALLDEAEPEARLVGVLALERFVASFPVAVELLAPALTDPDPWVRALAAGALRKTARLPDEAMDRLEELLLDNDLFARLEADYTLSHFTPGRPRRFPDAVAQLARSLLRGDADVRRNAVETLKRRPEEGVAAVPALLAAQKDVEPVAVLAWWALVGVVQHHPEVMPELIKVLWDKDKKLSSRVAHLCTEVGLPAARAAIGPLLDRLDEWEWPLNIGVAHALYAGRFGPEGAEALARRRPDALKHLLFLVDQAGGTEALARLRSEALAGSSNHLPS
jgi:hypothetical protein